MVYKKKQIHFVMVPFMAQGHMIPTIDFGRLLSERGMRVTIITTPVNLSRIQATVDRTKQAGLRIDFVPLRFPCAEAGLPDGCENIDILPTADLMKNFFQATAMLAGTFKVYIQDQQRKDPESLTCMISDFCHPWTHHISEELKVPRFVFYSICCFTIYLSKLLPRVEEVMSSTESEAIVPGLPHRIKVSCPHVPIFFPGEEFNRIYNEVAAADSAADGMILNTFRDMEPMYMNRFVKEIGKKVWPVGPVSFCNREPDDKAARGAKSSIHESRVLGFLDSMKPKSVVYVSLGTLVRLPLLQFIEIGTGLEAAGHPFIWVIKTADGKLGEVEDWLKNDGFEERTRTRSLIIRGWAPQMTILSHPSTGAFLTHCGWNSALEGIAAGIPMITWPCFSDQFLNENFIADVIRTGVAIGAKGKTFWDVTEATVVRENITKAVEKAMCGGHEGEERRKRATELGEMAVKAVEVGGSSYDYISLFIEELLGGNN